MPSNKPNQPNRAWKNQAGAAPANRGRRAWQGASAKPVGERKPWSRKAKVRIALGLLVVVVAGLIVLAYMLRWRRPACLVLVGASYDTNLAIPHNVFGWRGLEALSAEAETGGTVSSMFFWNKSGKMRKVTERPRTIDSSTSWKKVWEEVGNQKVDEDVIVFFLALHGGASSEGAYLLENGPDPAKDSRTYIKDILQDLKNAKHLEGKTKVLILDATQVRANWLGGMVYNDFVARLEEEIKGNPDLTRDLIVLTSTSAGERSWASEEWGQTVFAHFVIEGLKGAAGKEVTAYHLWEYVNERVASWAWANRKASQRPHLLGDKELAKTSVLVHLDKDYEGTDAPVAANHLDKHKEELKNAWEKARALQQTTPSPAVYSPHMWHCYQDALLRYEQLLRAENPEGAKQLETRLAKLGDEIEKARILGDVTFESRAGNLGMPIVLGGMVDDNEAKAKFMDAWTRWPDAKADLKAWLEKYPDPANEKAMKATLSRLTLAKILESDATRSEQFLDILGKAGQLLKHVWGTAQFPRSAEAHYLDMLVADADTKSQLPTADAKDSVRALKPPAPDLKLALEVRVLAEQVALALAAKENRQPRSEIIWPWIKDQIAMADRDRRLGEDWLFGSEEGHWKTAREHLTKARQQYSKARERAELVWNALDLRDRALAKLPYLARWAVERRPQGKQQDWQEIVNQVKDLAKEAFELAALLQDPVPGALDNLTKRLEDVAERIKEESANKALTALENLFDSESEENRQNRAQLQENWHETECLLTVPLLKDVGTRLALLDKSQEIARALHNEFLKGTRGKPDEPKGMNAETRKRAMGDARLALVLTGGTLLANPDREFEKDEKRLDQAELVPDGWQGPLAEVGEGIGKHWRAARDQVDQRQKDSTSQPNIAGNLEKAWQTLRPAEEYCRVIPGSAVSEERPEPFDAVVGMRRLRLHNVMLDLAGRAVGDHWYDGSRANQNVYYQRAARVFLSDARRLAELRDPLLNKGRLEAANQAEKNWQVGKTDKATGLIARAPKEKQRVTKNELEVKWELWADAGVLDDKNPGIPMLWPKVMTLEVKDKTLRNRQPLKEKLKTAKQRTQISYALQIPGFDEDNAVPGSPEPETYKVVLNGLYRGQRLGEPNDVDLYKSPNVIVTDLQPPPGAAVAFRMDRDFNYGAISIILDLSGSMNWEINDPNGDNPTRPGEAKIDYAKKALKEVLRSLPKGTFLSFFVYGHKNKAKETRIERKRPPKRWTGTREERELLVDVIDSLEAEGSTPLVESLVVAEQEGFPKATEYQGPKVILVLTDGSDNHFWNKGRNYPVYLPFDLTKKHKTTHVPTFLESEFNGKNIEIHVVCFAQKGDSEEKKARQQFEIVESLSSPGSFTTMSEPKQLAKALVLALRPKLVLVGDERPPGFPRDGLPASPPGDNLDWKELPEGEYTVRVGKGKEGQQLTIRSGDSMILAPKRFGERVLVGQTFLAEALEKEGETRPQGILENEWQAAVLQNRIEANEEWIKQLITLDRKAQRGGLLELSPPDFLWLEVAAREEKGPRPTGLSWHRDNRYPAPAYLLQSWWPGQMNGSTTVSIWGASTLGESMFKRLGHKAKEPVENMLDVLGPAKELALDDGVIIESIRIETHRVPIREGQQPEFRKCLVVRATYHEGKPVWVRFRPRPDRKDSEWGEKHLFYEKAGKYTALFWGLNDFNRNPFFLEVISLTAFKNARARLDLSVPPASGEDKGPPDHFRWIK
jgi:hypothetical protein